ncbi:hypothetical protein DPX39_060048900 [Trypanosoma brucei equiperdum]|uniref:Uncharacterized protein n=1 Tax=Trypanosoma brucei equiperdum TaxID=630700 RepID=A0A3L6L6P0_9TRYP|nr:hypothetical protein DPX39_060048900 [Trypanosoma brucei equiperdum]
MAPSSELNVANRAVLNVPLDASCPQQLRHANIEQDHQSVALWRQARLNEIVAEEEKQALISREDHRLMVRHLLSVACSRDPQQRVNATKWRSLMRAADDEFDTTEASFPGATDPYRQVVANLSSMMLWSSELRNWSYGYSTNSVEKCHERQREVLRQLSESRKLFLN